MNRSNQGSLLISIIITMVILAALGAGIASMLTTGVRSSTDHSLSIQAFYLAESGFEWTGKKLRENKEDWPTYCNETLKNIGQDIQITPRKHFTILSAEENNNPNGCKISVLGWLGNDGKSKNLASRCLEGTISQEFIEASGVSDWKYKDEIVRGKTDISELKKGLAKNATFKGKVNISNIDRDVFIGDDVRINGASQARMITGDVCIGNNFDLDGASTIQNVEGDVCFGDNFNHKGEGERQSIGPGRWHGAAALGQGKSNIDADIEGNLCFGDEAKKLKIEGDIGGNVCFGDNASNIEIKGDIGGDVFYGENCSGLCPCTGCTIVSQDPISENTWNEE